MQTIVHRRPGTLSTNIGKDVILMSLERGKYYGLGEIGSDIWRRIGVPVVVDQLCTALSAEYCGDPDAIAHDLIALLEQLARNNLLESQ